MSITEELANARAEHMQLHRTFPRVITLSLAKFKELWREVKPPKSDDELPDEIKAAIAAGRPAGTFMNIPVYVRE